MHHFRKTVCTILALLLLMQIVLLPVSAEEVLTEDPEVIKYAQEEELVEAVADEIFETEELSEETFCEEVIAEEILTEEIGEAFPEETLSEETVPAQTRMVYETVPLYFQTDYPNTSYGSGTVATSGCSFPTKRTGTGM